MRQTLLFLLTLWSLQQSALATHVSAVELRPTSEEFMWEIRTASPEWKGKLDCQSFFHLISLNDGKKELLKYLDAVECQDWHDALERASHKSPVCISTDPASGPARINCPGIAGR